MSNNLMGDAMEIAKIFVLNSYTAKKDDQISFNPVKNHHRGMIDWRQMVKNQIEKNPYKSTTYAHKTDYDK